MKIPHLLPPDEAADAEALRAVAAIASDATAHTSILDGAEAASVVLEGAEDAFTVAGLTVRPQTLSDYLLLVRKRNILVIGRSGEIPDANTRLIENIYAALEILFVASLPSSQQAAKQAYTDGEAWAAQVEYFGARFRPGDMLEIVEGAANYVAAATDTRVSAKAPTVSGSAPSTPGND